MALSSSPVAGKGHLGELVLPGKGWVSLTWMQPGLHRHLGDAMAPKVMLGTKGSPAAFSPKCKPELAKRFLLTKMRMLCSPHPLTPSNAMESTTGKANQLPLCKRKPAISKVTKPQLGTRGFSQPFLLHQETKGRPRFSHKHTWKTFLHEFTNTYHFNTSWNFRVACCEKKTKTKNC